jgi:hypothetical protein
VAITRPFSNDDVPDSSFSFFSIYIVVSVDKRNVGPKQTPEWTVERIDAYVETQGRAVSWARRARMGEFVTDPFETLDMTLGLRIYCLLTTFGIAFSFGRSTPTFLQSFFHVDNPETLVQGPLQTPALVFLLASLGSSAVCGFLLAPERKRNSFYWAVKGLLGGPLAIAQLKGLETRVTRQEDDDRQKLERKQL